MSQRTRCSKRGVVTRYLEAASPRRDTESHIGKKFPRHLEELSDDCHIGEKFPRHLEELSGDLILDSSPSSVHTRTVWNYALKGKFGCEHSECGRLRLLSSSAHRRNCRERQKVL